MPSSARLVSVGVCTSPPKVSAIPKPTSSIRTMMIAMDLERKKGVEIVDEQWWIIKDSWVRQQQWLG